MEETAECYVPHNLLHQLHDGEGGWFAAGIFVSMLVSTLIVEQQLQLLVKLY